MSGPAEPVRVLPFRPGKEQRLQALVVTPRLIRLASSPEAWAARQLCDWEWVCAGLQHELPPGPWRLHMRTEEEYGPEKEHALCVVVRVLPPPGWQPRRA